MRRQKNPSSDLVLIAGAGAALYFFWPKLSAMLSGTAAMNAGEIAPPMSAPAGPPPATSGPGSLTLIPPTKPGAATVTVAIDAASMNPPAPPASTPNALIPGQTYLNSPFGPIAVAAGTPGSFVQGGSLSGLSGPRPRPLRGSAAAIAEAALNQMLSDDAAQVTTNSPIGPWTPGAQMLPGGCWQYGNTPVLANCPPGVGAPRGRAVASGTCLPGFTMDAAGVCASSADQVMLAQLNSTPYAGPQSLPTQPLNPQTFAHYAATIGIRPASVLAAMLGLASNPSNGTMAHGNDGYTYLAVTGLYIRQGVATQSTRATGPIGPRLSPFPAGTKLKGTTAALTSVLPISNATLIAASSDPAIAALVGNDPRAMLTLPQWDYYYAQASGVLQGAPPWPEIDPNSLISASEYQAWRKSAGLSVSPAKLGIIRNSRPGMFPLGGISDGPIRQPFVAKGNTNIFRVPGRGAVRLGLIHSGGGNHRSERSPFPRPADWRMAE